MTFHPTSADPAIVTASDGTLFACWLEEIHDRLLWVFMNTAKMNYVGPPYNGEDSLEQVRDLVALWWSRTRADSELRRVDQSISSPAS
jgi:hypothetical protein